MTTTIANQQSGNPTSPADRPPGPRPVHRRRALLAVVVAAALGLGAGAVALTSSGGDSHPAHAVVAEKPQVDVQALWDELVMLPVRDQVAIVATLSPSVRAQLRTLTEAIAGAAEGAQGG